METKSHSNMGAESGGGPEKLEKYFSYYKFQKICILDATGCILDATNCILVATVRNPSAPTNRVCPHPTQPALTP